MVAGVPLIDLDRAPSPAVAAAALPRSRSFLVVALVAALLTLGGAAASEPGLTPVLTTEPGVTAFQLGGGSLFTAKSGEVRGYDLAGGSPRWTRAFRQDVQTLDYDAGARVLLAVSGNEPRLTALDADSGRTLWSEQASDTLLIGVANGAVLTRVDSATGPTRLRSVDARTGRLIWDRAVNFNGYLGPDELFTAGGSARIVLVDPGGAVTVLRSADGAVLAQGDLGVRFAPAVNQSLPSGVVNVSLVGDRLYVARSDRGRASLAAYSMEPIARLWEVDDAPIGTVVDCGSMLCVTGTRSVTAVDPADGAVRWAQSSYGIAFRYDAHSDFAYDNQEDPEAALLDAATGRVLRELGHSRQLGQVVLRADPAAPARTWVSAPEPGTGVLRTLGGLDGVASFRCVAADSYLVCPTTAGGTGVWRIR